VLPYAFDQGHTVGNFLVLTAALAYLGAVQMHYALYGGDAALTTAPVLETVTLMVVAMTLKEIPATLIQRIRRTRSIMGEAEHGFLAVRAAAQESDELGFLEKSFNKMIEEIGGTISTVQREAGEVAACGEQLAASAEQLDATSEGGTHAARRPARRRTRTRRCGCGRSGPRWMPRVSWRGRSGAARAWRGPARRCVRWARKYRARGRPGASAPARRSGQRASERCRRRWRR